MKTQPNLASRTVKGKKYFYLDKNVKTPNGKWQKISAYLGDTKPTQNEIKEKTKQLNAKETAVKKNHQMQYLTPGKALSKKPKVCLLFCGGTIAMKRNGNQTLVPTKSVEELLAIAPQIQDFVDLDYVFIANIDSTNMQPFLWTKLSEEIYKRYHQYDGFVVTHGTDTMAYTASALSFALQGLGKPIVLTGSQLPPDEPATDAVNNLINSCRLAGMNLSGVTICFGTKILQGNRSKKWSEVSLDAFVSHLTNDIGEVATTMNLSKDAPKRKSSKEKLRLVNNFEKRILQITLVPGTDPGYLEKIISTGECRGILLESFGAGNVPNKWNSFIPFIKNAKQNNIPVVVTTQCAGGTSSHMLTYEVGYEAVKAGAIPAKDMTAECSAVKLMWTLAQTNDMEKIRKIMLHNYANEFR